jgi:hypothetical protein
VTRNKYGILTKSKRPAAWTETIIRSVSDGLSLTVDRIEQEEFLQKCIAAVPDRQRRDGKRDTRRQDIIRSMRRLAELNSLPFKVVGDYFVF